MACRGGDDGYACDVRVCNEGCVSARVWGAGGHWVRDVATNISLVDGNPSSTFQTCVFCFCLNVAMLNTYLILFYHIPKIFLNIGP
jgi:hypothetical protein